MGGLYVLTPDVHVRRSSRNARESMDDEKGAKLGQPVTQSLILSPAKVGPVELAAAWSASSKPDDEPLIYLL